jgi:ribosomal protein RSM22 (predicted rRNA methylase)
VSVGARVLIHAPLNMNQGGLFLYYFDEYIWMDLKQAVALKDMDWIDSIMHKVEMRRYTMMLDARCGNVTTERKAVTSF